MKVKEESEKAGLTQDSKNEDHGFQVHHFMTNRWGNNGNSDRLYFLGERIHLNKSCWNIKINTWRKMYFDLYQTPKFEIRKKKTELNFDFLQEN